MNCGVLPLLLVEAERKRNIFNTNYMVLWKKKMQHNPVCFFFFYKDNIH